MKILFNDLCYDDYVYNHFTIPENESAILNDKFKQYFMINKEITDLLFCLQGYIYRGYEYPLLILYFDYE